MKAPVPQLVLRFRLEDRPEGEWLFAESESERFRVLDWMRAHGGVWTDLADALERREHERPPA